MADYINPTAIRPEYGWKPQGFLGGMNYARDRARYEDVSSLQDYMMKNQAVESGGKLQDYLSDAPVREAKRLADVATSRATTSTIGGIKQNELTKGGLDNELSAKTMSSKIAEAATKASMEGDKSSMQSLATGAAIGRALGAAAGNGPGALAGVLQQLQQSKADPRIIQWFSNSRSPQELMQKAKMITDAFMEANTSYRQSMDTVKVNAASREKAAGIAASASRDVAAMRAKDQIKSIDRLLQDVLKLKAKERVGAYKFIMNHPEATPQQQNDARQGYAEAEKIVNLEAKSDDAPILGADGKPILPAPIRRTLNDGPARQGGNEDKFVVGKKYTDANGNTATYQGNGKWSQ